MLENKKRFTWSNIKHSIQKLFIRKKQKTHKNEGKDFLLTVVFALIFTILFRSFVFDPFQVPSESMLPTLLPGDKMFVSKFEYGYSKHSFPKKMINFKGRIFGSVPKRGDVVVFAMPQKPKIFYVKRVIGLPNDTVQVKEGILFVNDKALSTVLQSEEGNNSQSYNNMKEIEEFAKVFGTFHTLQTFTEINHDNVEYEIALSPSFQIESSGNTEVYKVPENHIFVMGDNRGNSMDSRFPSPGFIPLENLVGKAKFVFFSSKKNLISSILQPSNIRKERFFKNLSPKAVQS